MTDITNLFKATVKTIKSRNKAQGLSTGPDKSILGHAKHKGEFATKAKDVVNSISKLKEFLLKYRKDYINAANYLGKDTKMTDAQRDQIDQDAEGFMKTCSEAIRSLKKQDTTDKNHPQNKDHRDAVFQLMENYLKVVCQIYSEQRAIRVKRVVDKKRIAKLEPLKKYKNDEIIMNGIEKSEDDEGEPNEKSESSRNHVRTKTKKQLNHLEESSKMEDELSPEETQLFAMENQQLYEEMNSMVDEVKQIEGKVVEITRLQEIFADQVLEQEQDIDRIAGTVVGTTENIKEANEEIREAMKNNAGLRVWILFFLIVLSFTLLFLDWYND